MQISVANPGCDDARLLIDELDRFLSPLYPAESHYLLDVESLRQPNVVFLVARDDAGTAIGCGALVIHPDYGELKRMYVRLASRGRGVGKLILERLEREAGARGIDVLRLETGVRQPEAIGLYERHGYRRRGPFGDYPNDPLCLFFEKELKIPT